MDNVKVIIASVVLALLVALGVTYLGPARTDTVREIIRELGAVPGNELQGPVVKLNGAPIVALSQRFTTGTTSVCSFDVRGSARYGTSSIISLGAVVNGVPTTTTGSIWRWYKSVNGFATTTLIAGRSAITATGTAVFATTTLAADAGVLGAGDDYLVLDFQGGSVPYLDINGQTGSCSVLLLAPNAQ